MDRLEAPFTEDQRSSVNGYQLSGVMHPFTCGKSYHGGYGFLEATRGGLYCIHPECTYTQNWVWRFTADWSWLALRRGEPRHTDRPENHMGTRGFIGFLAEGELKIAYNHFDSYPGGLGVEITEWLRKADLFEAKNQAVRLRVVQSDERPTREEIDRVAALGLYTLRPEGEDNPDWYWLLRETQGHPDRILKAGVIEDASNFPYDSLFCEWGYLLDFDEGILEVYKGFQHEKPTSGRFIEYPEGTEPRAGIASEYWPVNMVRTYFFDLLPDTAEFLAQLEDSE